MKNIPNISENNQIQKSQFIGAKIVNREAKLTFSLAKL